MPEKINFSTDLYDVDAINAIAEAYGHLAKIEVEQSADAVIVTFSEENPDHIDVLYDSFSNHALYETIVRKRQEVGGGMF